MRVNYRKITRTGGQIVSAKLLVGKNIRRLSRLAVRCDSGRNHRVLRTLQLARTMSLSDV